MCKEGQSLLIDRGKGNVGKVLREHHLGRHFSFLYKENPALDAGFRERYAFDQKSSKS